MSDEKDQTMQLDMARALLKKEGLKVLTEEQFKDRLARATSEMDPLKAQNEELTERLRTVEKQLQVYTEKDQTADEKHKAEIEKFRAEAAGYKQRYKDEASKAERERNARKAEYVQTQLQELLPDAAVPKRVLVRELLDQRPGFSAEDTETGQFRLAYTGQDSIPGEPKETVAEWYKEQTWAHKPTGERVPTNGAPPPGKPTQKPMSEMSGVEAAQHVADKQFKN